MRRLLSVAIVLALGLAWAGPVGGPKNSSQFQVPASRQEGVPGSRDLLVECQANERTSVLVKGDHQPVANLELLVFYVVGDEETLVARDFGTADLLGVEFVPPRAGTYRIVVRNPAPFHPERNPHNNCYLSVQ